jgi:L-cysteine S-thiosulfotransferase
MTVPRTPIALAAAALVWASLPASGQDHSAHGQAPSPRPAGPQRYTMEALHAAGGVPPGWRFTLPSGDAAAGRQAFVDLKCYACHAIQGEQFPLPAGESATAGPELTGMGGHHPPEYLAESIVNPSAVLIDAPGYIGGDGRSIMPTYPGMTLAQLVNVVAYLKSLGAPAQDHGGPREQVAGAYRVRIAYKKAEEQDPHAHGAGAAMPAMAAQGTGQLIAFVSDAASGHPLPYSTVRARIESPSKPMRTVTLAPTLGPEGFHYGAKIDLPDDTARIALSIRPTSMRLAAGADPGLKRAETVTFDWK